MQNQDTLNGIIFDIQPYAVYDGPGIRTTIFFKGCPLHCIWCQNPESQVSTRQISYLRNKCLMCQICLQNCPNRALSVKDNRIQRDENLCSICAICVKNCPTHAMQIVGINRTVTEIVEEVSLDTPFFQSGGGITISGGEPTLQFPFLINLLAAFHAQGIHTALETCGYFPSERASLLSSHVDLFLFDFKHPDSSIHKQFTGVSNDIILDNFRTLLETVGDTRIIVRIPLIPNINTDPNIIKHFLKILLDMGYRGPIHLMPYNKLTKTKYEKLGRLSSFQDFGELTENQLSSIIDLIEKAGFHVLVNH